MQQSNGWKKFDDFNNQTLQGAGMDDPQLRRKALRSLYQDYKDFYDNTWKINRADCDYVKNWTDCDVVFQDYKNQRNKRKSELNDLLKDKTRNKNIRAKFLPILEEDQTP
jgi:hypothetical protein